MKSDLLGIRRYEVTPVAEKFYYVKLSHVSHLLKAHPGKTIQNLALPEKILS